MQAEDSGIAHILTSQNEHNDNIKYLIEGNADVNVQAEDGGTMLT